MPRYGNLLEALPESALGLPSLKELWLENNPLGDAGRLRPSDAEHHLALGPKLRSVGLDQWQVSTTSLHCSQPLPCHSSWVATDGWLRTGPPVKHDG